MLPADVNAMLWIPSIVVLKNGSRFAGCLRDNGDGTYSVDSELGTAENQAIVQRFTAEEMESITPH